MLTPLQQRVARIVADLPDADDFVLAGGGALIARGDVDRTTRDLDYFATRPERVLELLPHLVAALEEAGLTVETHRAVDGFVRLVVTDGAEATDVDRASDYRLLPPEPTPAGRALAAEELAVDKVLAIFDRGEGRDFADLAAVVDRWGLDHLLRRAKEKDGGFSTAFFVEALDRAVRLRDEDFRVPIERVSGIRAAIAGWRLHVASLPRERRSGTDELGR